MFHVEQSPMREPAFGTVSKQDFRQLLSSPVFAFSGLPPDSLTW